MYKAFRDPRLEDGAQFSPKVLPFFQGTVLGGNHTWRCIEVVITALTRNRPGDLEHPLAEILIFQGFPGLEKVRTSCFLS